MPRIAAITLLLALTACGAPQAAQQVTEATGVPTEQPAVQATPTAESTNTPEPTATLLPTDTPRPTRPPTTSTPRATRTPQPTNTPVATPTPEITADDIFGLNFLAAQEQGGIRLEIARVVIARKRVLDDIELERVEEFNDVEVAGELIFRVTNLSDQKLTVRPFQGTVVVNGEQIDLSQWYAAGTSFGREANGEIFPGATAIGGLWFGIKRSDVPQINKIAIGVDSPHNEEYRDVGEDFYFEIDLSNHEYQEHPPELE
jgi:hypothetical protein